MRLDELHLIADRGVVSTREAIFHHLTEPSFSFHASSSPATPVPSCINELSQNKEKRGE
jgi:hypothetical protein